jgi:hypothetical protein
MTPSEYQEHKALHKRTSMIIDRFRMIFLNVGEASTKEISVNKNAQEFDENNNAAKIGGAIAENAIRSLEQKLEKCYFSRKL